MISGEQSSEQRLLHLDEREIAKYLSAHDPILACVIQQVGYQRLKPQKGYFEQLCKAIIAQQVSTKAANVIFGRFKQLFPRRCVQPRRLLDLSPEQLRTVGISKQKIDYLKDLACHFSSKQIMPTQLARCSDQQVIEQLTQVRGIGEWTAEMFLIFALARPNVFSANDHGIRTACCNLYQLEQPIRSSDLLALSQRWHPVRSWACLYLWASLNNGDFSA